MGKQVWTKQRFDYSLPLRSFIFTLPFVKQRTISISQRESTMLMPFVCCCFRKTEKKDHEQESEGNGSNETDGAAAIAYAPAIGQYFKKDKKDKNSDDEASIVSSASSIDTIDPNTLFVPLIWCENTMGYSTQGASILHQMCTWGERVYRTRAHGKDHDSGKEWRVTWSWCTKMGIVTSASAK